MESIYIELALYGSKNECARTDNVYFAISEVCDGMDSLNLFDISNTVANFAIIPSSLTAAVA